LAFAGEGPLQDQMQQLASELGIQDKVRFLGFRRDIPTLIRAAIATVLVSEQEGLPRSIMESLCMGVPAIGTAIRGTKDLLETGSGLLVPVGDTEALSQAFSWVLNHPEQAQAMGNQGREQMYGYDLKRIMKLHEILYADAFKQVRLW
jgi:glycosyltransferase involved in cell wall biosynthesis